MVTKEQLTKLRERLDYQMQDVYHREQEAELVKQRLVTSRGLSVGSSLAAGLGGPSVATGFGGSSVARRTGGLGVSNGSWDEVRDDWDRASVSSEASSGASSGWGASISGSGAGWRYGSGIRSKR